MAATKGTEPLLESMEKEPKAPRVPRELVLLVVAAVAAATIGVVLAVRRSGGSPSPAPAPAPSALTVPTTAPYNPRPGPGGTRILTEPVDPLSLAVPAGWSSPAADPPTLIDALDKFALQAPPLAVLLEAEGQVAAKSAVRLFAFSPAAPHAFVAVVSFSSPQIPTPTPAAMEVLVAQAKKRSPNVAVSAAALPVGPVLKLDSSFVSQNQHLVVEVLVLIAGGRTIEIEMVAETNEAAIPAVFAPIAQSLHLG